MAYQLYERPSISCNKNKYHQNSQRRNYRDRIAIKIRDINAMVGESVTEAIASTAPRPLQAAHDSLLITDSLS